MELLKQSGVVFVVRWIFNNIIAMAVGIVAGGMFGMTSFLSSRIPAQTSWILTGDILVGLFIGLVAGYLQSAQLNPWLGSRLPWITTSTLGWRLRLSDIGI